MALAALPLRASADAARAWAAARDNLPANTKTVVGADLTALAKTSLWKQLVPLLMKQDEMKKGFDIVKSACKLDPMAVIHGAVIAFGEEANAGVMFLSLGIDEPKLIKCFEEITKVVEGKNVKFVAKKTGSITEIPAGGTEKAYLGWIGSDVIAIAFEAKSRAALEKWLGGKGALARAPVSKSLAAANTKAAVWAATASEKELDPGVTMKGGHAALTFGGGNLAIDLRVGFNNSKAASDAATKATSGLAAAMTAGNIPESAKTIAKQVSIKANGAEVAVKTSIAESAVMPLISTLIIGGL